MVEDMIGDNGSPADGWIYVPASALPDLQTYTELGAFRVDGETFTVRRRDSDGSHHYDWVTGPNEGYGFSVSGGAGAETPQRHLATIRDFLSGIDLATGYLSYL